MSVTFPRTISVVNGQSAGAALLNAYSHAVLCLSGQSHAPYACHTVPETHTVENNSDVWVTYFYYWQILRKKTYYYGFRAYENSGGAKEWHWQLQYEGDDDNWYTIFYQHGTQGSYTWINNEGAGVDLSGAAQITAGKIYRLRLQGKTDDDSYNGRIQPYYFVERDAVSGWTDIFPPDGHALAVDEQSDEADFNCLKTDAELLNALLPPVNPSTGMEATKKIATTTYTRVVCTGYRYRRGRLYMAAEWEASTAGTPTTQAQFRVRFTDQNGNVATVHESSALNGTGKATWWSATVNLLQDPAAAALTAEGITLTLGAYYRVQLEVKRVQGSEWLYVYTAVASRWSTGSQNTGWADPRTWAVNNTVVGPTHMNKYRTDLNILYNGNEALWGEIAAQMYVEDWSDGAEDHSLVHRKRWLIYYHQTDKTPSVHYGANYAGTFDLEQRAAGEDVFKQKDLSEIPVPWGTYYWVSGCDVCWESDTILVA